MSREYGKKLTRADLEEYGFIDAIYKPETDEWKVFRYWPTGPGEKCELTCKHISLTKDKHPYGNTYRGKIVQFSYHHKQITVPLGKFIWAWVKGEVPAGKKVAHTGKDLSLDSYELKDVGDHDYYEHKNQYQNGVIRSIADIFKHYDYCDPHVPDLIHKVIMDWWKQHE